MKSKYKHVSCEECDAKCCKYVALEIDTPTCKRDYDQIRWFLLHHDVHVYIDHDKSWNLEFLAECDELGSNNLCGNYGSRPRLCREYGSEDDCEMHDHLSEPYIEMFYKPVDLEKYLTKKKIDWKFK